MKWPLRFIFVIMKRLFCDRFRLSAVVITFFCFMGGFIPVKAQGKTQIPNQTSLVSSPNFVVGYLNKQVLLDSLPEVQMIHQQLNGLQKVYDKAYKNMEEDYYDLLRRYLNDKPSLGEALRMARQAEITESELRMRAFLEHSKQEIDSLREEKMHPILQKLQLGIALSARQYHCNMVLDEITPLYVDDSVINLNEVVYQYMIQ